MKKQFIGDSTCDPFASTEVLSQVIDNAREITKATFLKHCDISKKLRTDMKKWSGDYIFGKYKDVYFFAWNKVKHFYI